MQNLVETVGNTNDELSSALQRISQYENIPRKKPKFIVSKCLVLNRLQHVYNAIPFQNFLKNVLGNRVHPRIIGINKE